VEHRRNRFRSRDLSVGPRQPLAGGTAPSHGPASPQSVTHVLIRTIPGVQAATHPAVVARGLPPAQRASDPAPAVAVIEPRRRAMLLVLPESQRNHLARHTGSLAPWCDVTTQKTGSARRRPSPARHRYYPETTQYRWHESPPAIAVRESCTHRFHAVVWKLVDKMRESRSTNVMRLARCLPGITRRVKIAGCTP
jgi:hypothetical protein